jgi:hypothetical protein
LLSRFATGLATTGAGMDASTACMLSRERMLVTATPANKKQPSAMMVIALVKQLSVRAFEPPSLS